MATLLSPQDRETTTEQEANDRTSKSSSKQIAKCYQADGQVKFLHLQAEIDMLLHELQTLKQQKEFIAKQSLSTK